MMIIILVIVIALVAWSLQLMQEAVEQREFSLMLGRYACGIFGSRVDDRLFFNG